MMDKAEAVAVSVVGAGVACAIQAYLVGILAVYVAEKVADRVTP